MPFVSAIPTALKFMQMLSSITKWGLIHKKNLTPFLSMITTGIMPLVQPEQSLHGQSFHFLAVEICILQ